MMSKRQRCSSRVWFCHFLNIGSSGVVSIRYDLPLPHRLHGLLAAEQLQAVVVLQACREGGAAAWFVLVDELGAVSSSCPFACPPVPSK